MITIAAIIGTENNPSLFEACIQRLTFVNQIIVTDLSNNNEIKKLVETKGDKRVKHFFDTDRDLKNRFVKYQEMADTDFIFLLSPDEWLTDKLQVELSELISSNAINNYDFIGLRSLEYSFGCFFGSSAYYTYRIIRKGYYKIYTDNVHEEPRPNERVYHAQNFYEHYSNPTVAVNAVKMFKFEMINAAKLNESDLNKLSLEGISNTRLFKEAFVAWLRISVRFWRMLFGLRKYGYGAIAYAYMAIIRSIAEHVSPTQEKQFRVGKVDRNDTRGYL
jgi:hypothetical protein